MSPSATPMPPIIFGTDGWRARIADEFTYDAVRRCAEGVARYAVDGGNAARGVVVGYDRRFASEFFAQAAAEVLLAHDVPVMFAREALPTQMVSYEVLERQAACGIVITASHNPWTDNGFKVKSETGAAAGPAILTVLETTIHDRAADQPPRRPFADGVAAGQVEFFDSFDGYAALRGAHARPRSAAPGAHARAGRADVGVRRRLDLAPAGRRHRSRSTEIHTERNPFFGGVNPEPIRPNIDEALGILAGGGYDLGLLLDGDADRAGAADERGRRSSTSCRSWAC